MGCLAQGGNTLKETEKMNREKKMEGLISLVLGYPHVYMVIEKYLKWQDLVHLMCTCRELYYDWVSKDTEKWKSLRLPQKICKVLGIPYPSNHNPIKIIRQRALDSSAIDILSYSNVPCMGGCGQSIQNNKRVSYNLTYVICQVCAARSLSIGFWVVERYLISHTLTRYPYNEACRYGRLILGEKWAHNSDAFICQWMVFSRKLRMEPGWNLCVFKINDVTKKVDKLLKRNKWI